MNALKEKIGTTILHYTAPPVIGGVESVIKAHASQFIAAGLPLKIIAGRGESSALPKGIKFVRIPLMDTLHPEIQAATNLLDQGILPENFNELTEKIVTCLRPELIGCENLIVHNVLTKHFNLPLTAALFRLVDEKVIRQTLAWCHDLTWTSPNSRKKVFPQAPWTLLKTRQPNTTYIAISEKRRLEISESFGIDPSQIPVIHNGVEPETLLTLTAEGLALVNRLDLWKADIILLMPVRITEAKSIEFAINTIKELVNLKLSPKLVITGPPDPHSEASMNYYRELADLKKALELDDHVHFVFESGTDPKEGYQIDSGILSELFRVADAVFMPSHREGFGMPILEAGLVGMPIISTAIPAVQDLRPDGALVFDRDLDPHQLAVMIQDWIKRKPELEFKARVRHSLTWRAIFENQILPLLEENTNS